MPPLAVPPLDVVPPPLDVVPPLPLPELLSSLPQPEAANNIQGRFLILHGAEDTIAPLGEVNKLINDFRAAKVAWQMELYGGTEHGFSTPKNAAEERANTLSQAATVRFLSEIFGN